MSAFAPPVQRLITELSKLPGIGGRSAQRLAFHVLRASDEEAAALAAINEGLRAAQELAASKMGGITGGLGGGLGLPGF